MREHRYWFSKAAAKAAGSNGGKVKNSGHLVYVDGKAWRLPALAAAAGVTRDAMRKRIGRARANGTPLTNDNLKLKCTSSQPSTTSKANSEPPTTSTE